MVKVGYLGPKGTFSEEATSRYFNGQGAELVPLQTIMDVLDEVKEGNIDKGVVPIENSIEGAINMTVDSLADCKKLYVQGEIVLNVSQYLLGNKGASLEEIKEVWSIPPAIAQCRKFIRNELKATIRNFDSTAEAATEVKRSGRLNVAAVASSWAAKQMELKILASGIQENSVNHTRFVVVTKGEKLLEAPKKTMLLILPSKDYSGMLVNILNVFASLSLNLTWIESRPTKRKLGTYQFFMDVEAGVGDERLEKALSILEIIGHEVRVMGSYNTTHLQS